MKISDCDQKWIDALKVCLNGGIVPFFRAGNVEVDAQRTLNNFVGMITNRKVEE